MKGDIRRIEAELHAYHERLSMADSARAATLAMLVDQAASSHAETQRLLDSVTAEVRRLTLVLGDLRGELTEVQRELTLVQELAGQSETSLRELRAVIQSTRDFAAAEGEGGRTMSDAAESARLFDQALELLNRGSTTTARAGFFEFIRTNPGDPRAPDALFWIAESYYPTNPDSAAFYFNYVVSEAPESPRAASALYKMGLIAEDSGNGARALEFYERLVTEFSLSDAARLACDKIRQSGGEVPESCRPD